MRTCRKVSSDVGEFGYAGRLSQMSRVKPSYSVEYSSKERERERNILYFKNVLKICI